ncbi:hypothetical protein E8D34_13405 [Nocardioides sp. GY 10113]|uniref:carboxypeptidase-like regulatory domain-containing protein n=1 Tax=Nocardioides sp. GY 10113 TaxID=2569761 RepID=UPI0010A8EB72|nr:carboxypeptidase-like regulatory domain-containing protein [Nocardioides sp. GY 10113]TIC85066.1 hypothetical protein E8D34_13405 [Nocardioides sp. GY 10113]
MSVPRLLAALTAGLTTLGAVAHVAPTAAAADTGPGWVTGVVVDTSGNPVEGALVNVLPPRRIPDLELLDSTTDRRAHTDADGRFRVRQDSRGFLIQVCDDHSDAPTSCTLPSDAAHLMRYVGPDGQFDSWVLHTDLYDATATDLEVGTVEVQDPARIEGTLEGAAFERIQLMRLNDTVAWNGQTDQHGAFAFEGLVPGAYYVKAGGFGSLPWRSEEVTIDADHPGLVHGSLDHGVTLTGRAFREATGTPARRTEIFLTHGDGELIASLFTNRRGRYRFTGLTPGDYRVGKLREGGALIPHRERVTVAEEDQKVTVPVPLVRGASATFRLRGTEGRVDSELRTRSGKVLYPNILRKDGTATYPGLRRGTYTLVAKDGNGYGLTTFRVRGARAYDLGRLRLDKPLLTLRGRAAPYATVQANTSEICPPDAPQKWNGFQEVEAADANGRYVIRGLVPGDKWTVAAHGYRQNFAPICHDNVKIHASRRYDIPLAVGRILTGRLVYAGTDRPAITNIGYQVTYPAGLATNPNPERPARSRIRGSSGEFTITQLSTGTATGGLASTPLDILPELWVHMPYQPGTPFWLEAPQQDLTIEGDVDLGDIELSVHGAA